MLKSMIIAIFIVLFIPINSQPAFAEKSIKKPFAEYQHVGTLVMSAKPYFNGVLQEKIFSALPQDVTVILFSQDQEDLTFAEELWGARFSNIDFRYLQLPSAARTQKGISYFAVDAMPYPVLIHENNTQYFTLIDAQYKAGFEPDSIIANILGMPRRFFPYVYEYGNFIANDEGICVIINGMREQLIADAEFRDTFGCERLIRLPRLKIKNMKGEMLNKGLGHIDERVKFLKADYAITDSQEYKVVLEKEGINTVVLLPEASTPENPYRTYINARLINGTAFVPTYNTITDEAAMKAYNDAGFKTVAVESIFLSDFGKGSLHCATSTYPPLPEGIKYNFYTN